MVIYGHKPNDIYKRCLLIKNSNFVVERVLCTSTPYCLCVSRHFDDLVCIYYISFDDITSMFCFVDLFSTF